ncbi:MULTISPECIES: NAD(P)-dependent oxidoreductase [Leuconostoc]|uniref:NADH dehydrogenase n=2 Tax=Leuconostoc kimchii TaxID=136609 RepID=D5T2W0_LEUKI|nr:MULTISPECIES: NAD-dependent epimerase/dehydratase family protein [Leuconostoc]ADG40609.1 NADH dehydrogenase [Leuconostoc kimchii IMSNU 11154]AEJ31409.1 NADH dehydrogenase [Leuconostoc sp. C2]QBR47069.1 NAD-dependent epimerase/dehydratase family protein [Leuconostoc kimchii]
MDKFTQQKVVIVGGTGFVGQGLIKHLSPELFDVHSISRHVFSPNNQDTTTYHAVDLSDPTQWRAIVSDADWVIDAVGILFPNPLKHQSYQKNSVSPAKQIIDVLLEEKRPNFLFVSANTGPFFMKPYLNAKSIVEQMAATKLSQRAFMVYPGIIFDHDRLSSYLPGLIAFKLRKIPYFKHLRAIPRNLFASEIEQILLGHDSIMSHRTLS